MPIFPRNNLPTDSLNWGREVERGINNLESGFRTAEVNNVSRDAQLQSNVRRLDATVTQLAATTTAADQAQSDAITALQAAQTAQSNATIANNNAIAANSVATQANTKAIEALTEADAAQADALEALQEIIDLGSPGGPTINAANITAGSISGNRITGGVITGAQLTTAAAGNQRVLLESNQIKFNNGSSDTGSIYGSTFGSQAATYIQGNACVISSTQGNYFVGATGVFGGSFSAENGILTPSTGSITSGAAIVRSQLNGDGLGLTGASITATGNFVRTSSSARYKQDIQDLELPYEAILNLRPKTFRRKEEVEELGEKAKVYPGFIAEDIADSQLDIFAFYRIDEAGNKIPEGVHYPELTAALVSAIKHQDGLIKSLEARLAALEDRVQ